MDERDGKDQGIQIVGYLIAGLLLYGGVGWLVDAVFHTSWALPLGVMVGLGLAVYLIIKRYGGNA